MTMRTTVRLPDDLIRRAKRKAAAEGRTLTALIEQGLREVVSRKAERPAPVIPRTSAATGGFAKGYEFLDSPKLATFVQEIEDDDYIARLANGFK